LEDYDKVIVDDKLTQADLIKLMLHNAQHMATREEVKSDIDKIETSLKADMSKLDDKISRVETSLKADMSKLDDKISKVESSLKADMIKLDDKISKVESSLKADMSKLDDKISRVDGKFDKVQWLIVTTILTVLLKDYIFSFLK